MSHKKEEAMQKEIETITINDVEYVRKSDVKETAEPLNGMPVTVTVNDTP